ncbi:MAG: 23S rRNA (uracil(1939)-C(5))-methyltransferase RlmD [Lachnospiraceae bacterium]|nr:23S rRNA (uracil(1939)-C(5))-methyltransferase RlmD [Lachnospiraceae bacterium]
MKKGEIVEGVIESVRYPNKGLMQGRTENGEEALCCVKNTVPGQRVRARAGKKKGGAVEAQLLEVLEKAPGEIEPPCPLFGACGGCTYLNLTYKQECDLKEKQVRELLAGALREAGADEDLSWFEGIQGSPKEYEYRNKMEFSFGDSAKDGPLELGMHRRGSFYDVLTADQCRLVDEDYRRIVHAVRSYFAQQGTPYFHRGSHEGYLRHLLVRKAAHTGEILVDLITAPAAGLLKEQETELLAGFKDTVLGLPLDGVLAGILHTVNGAVSDIVRDDGTELLYGREEFTEKLLGLSFHVTPFSFFQTNSESAEVLYSTVRAYLEDFFSGREAPLVYDLYCGTGTISQLIAASARKVIGVEIVEEAVRAAQENARENGIENCTFLAGDVLKVMDQIEEKPDLVILDPPRDGIHPKAMPKILAFGVEQILYISCKPTSLARDLPFFYAAGYRAVRGCCLDQFPWTTGIETVCLLSHSFSSLSEQVESCFEEVF